MAKAVLDSSAVLAFILKEPGTDAVSRYSTLSVCAVNHAEVVGKLTDYGMDAVTLEANLRSLAYDIEPFDAYRAEMAARLRSDAKARRLSLGDRACLSLGLRTGLPVLTADRAWAELELGVDVRLIR